jgi:ribosomal-protein-alanine N-acetyltransferase
MSSYNPVIYRQLESRDVPAMRVIEELCFASPWSIKSLAEEMEDNPYAFYLGAFYNNILVGYIGIWRIVDEAHMTNLAVHPVHRRQGFARELLKRIKRYAFNSGAMSMTLEVRESNKVAQNLYAQKLLFG